MNSCCAIAAWLECFQEKPITVSTGLPGEESVKRFERSNGLDTALYKTIPFFYVSRHYKGLDTLSGDTTGLLSDPKIEVFCVCMYFYVMAKTSEQ